MQEIRSRNSTFEIHLTVVVQGVVASSTELFTKMQILNPFAFQEPSQTVFVELWSVLAGRDTTDIHDAVYIMLLQEMKELFWRLIGMSNGV